MKKTLKHNEEAGEKYVNLEKQLIDIEPKNIEKLTKYL